MIDSWVLLTIRSYVGYVGKKVEKRWPSVMMDHSSDVIKTSLKTVSIW